MQAVLAEPCSSAAAAAGWTEPKVHSGELPLDFEALIASLSAYRAVLIGERHDALDHHLNQLELICRLRRRGRIAIGLEAFHQSFQTVLDDYVAGRIGEAEMLVRSEYFDRWRFDFRLYAPIVRFARTHGLALVALNVPSELVSRVGRAGLGALTPVERARLPAEMPAAGPAYLERLRAVFDEHDVSGGASFEYFVQAQIAWDEGMAEHAAGFLDTNPGHRLVVIAGAGHIEYGAGIPERLERRAGLTVVSVAQGDDQPADPRAADFRLYQPEPAELPPAGAMGVRLNTEAGALEVSAFAESSAAREAGLEVGDRLVGIGAREIQSYADLRVAMLGKLQGERVKVRVARPGAERPFDVELTLR